MSEGAVSLYFGLKEGEIADLEVVAEAALEWAGIVRAAAVTIDPQAKVNIGLVDAEESSLRLNAVLEWAEDTLARIKEGPAKYPRIYTLAVALAAFIALQSVERAMDVIFDTDPSPALSAEDRNLLNNLLDQLRDAPEVEDRKRKFYRKLEHDPSILDVGVSEGHKNPPIIRVPSNQFPERGGLWMMQEDPQKRTSRQVLDVTLVSPVLISTPRSWEFQLEGLPTFRAVMKDERFLNALDQSHVHETLRSGIRMTIRLEVKEENIDGEWRVKHKGRSVTEVLLPEVD